MISFVFFLSKSLYKLKIVGPLRIWMQKSRFFAHFLLTCSWVDYIRIYSKNLSEEWLAIGLPSSRIVSPLSVRVSRSQRGNCVFNCHLTIGICQNVERKPGLKQACNAIFSFDSPDNEHIIKKSEGDRKPCYRVLLKSTANLIDTISKF